MVVFANPPQPIPTAIRNAVTFHDRVSMLLNGAGSSKSNPIQSKNPSGEDATGANGHAFRLKFSMADSSETIVSAVAALAGDSGEIASDWTSFKSSVVRDLSSYTFVADLVIGQHFPSIILPSIQDGPAQLVIVSIRTSLGRAIHQQVWVAREPSDMVLFNGIETSESAPLLLEMPEIDPSGNSHIAWSVQFFAGWNDEIGRQHGAPDVALSANIVKPYGGAKTVEIRRTTIGGSVFLSETPIHQVKSMAWNPTAENETQKFIFIFRSETGSSHYVSKAAWVKFFSCEEGGGGGTDASNNPPEIEPPSGGLVFTFGVDVVVDVVSKGDGVGTNAENPSVDIVLTGYKGGNSTLGGGGAHRPVAGVASGTKVVNTATLGEQTIDISTGDIAQADLIVVEVQNVAGTQLGNSLVYVRDDLATVAEYPKVPNVSLSSPAMSFNFTTREVTFGLTATVFPSSQLTLKATPLWGAMSNPSGAPQTIANAFLTAGVTKTANLVDVTTGTKTVAFAAWSEAGTPEAVLITIENTQGQAINTGKIILNGSPTDAAIVKKGATIANLAFGELFDPKDSLSFDITDTGGQVGNFTCRYAIVDSNQQVVEQNTGFGVSPIVEAKAVFLGTPHDDIDGHYFLWLVGEQGNSNVLKLANTSGSNTLPE